MAAEVITVEHLRQLLHIQTELREQAETAWRRSQRALVSLLETFAPEEVDSRLKSGLALDSLPVDELENLVRQRLAQRLQQALLVLNEAGHNRPGHPIRIQLQNCQAALEKAREENRRLAEANHSAEQERDALLGQLSALQQVSRMENASAPSERTNPGPTGAPEPDWLTSWRQAATFGRDAEVLKLLGRSGLARRPQVEILAAETPGIQKAGGSIQALFVRLADLGLLEVFRPWKQEGSGAGGRWPDLFRLTEKGELAYWLLCAQLPADNEFDRLLVRHVSPEHTLLNLQAADLLRQAGYQVDPAPADLHLPDGGVFHPDLQAVNPDGKVLFIEVERDAHKDSAQRQAKWRNALAAGGGELYVICDNVACMRSVRSEINYFLGSQRGRVFLATLAEAQAGKRSTDGSLWLYSLSPQP